MVVHMLFSALIIYRGFYPKGGGEVVVTPTPLKGLSPVHITDPGTVERVRIHAFVAGAVPPKVHTHTHTSLISSPPSSLHAHLHYHFPYSCTPSHPLSPNKVSRQLVHSASRLIQRELPNIKIDVSEVQETPATAFGNSSGIM